MILFNKSQSSIKIHTSDWIPSFSRNSCASLIVRSRSSKAASISRRSSCRILPASVLTRWCLQLCLSASFVVKTLQASVLSKWYLQLCLSAASFVLKTLQASDSKWCTSIWQTSFRFSSSCIFDLLSTWIRLGVTWWMVWMQYMNKLKDRVSDEFIIFLCWI